MLRSNKFWIIVSVVLLLIALVMWLSQQEEKPFKRVHLTQNNVVANYTDMNFLDTIAHVGLDTLGLCDITLYIKPLSKNAKDNFGSEIELKALMYGHGDEYVIWIDHIGKEEGINVISHELIHLLQYRSRELVYEGFYVYWNRAKYDIKETAYMSRPWEVDAFERQAPLQRTIRSVLY